MGWKEVKEQHCGRMMPEIVGWNAAVLVDEVQLSSRAEEGKGLCVAGRVYAGGEAAVHLFTFDLIRLSSIRAHAPPRPRRPRASSRGPAPLCPRPDYLTTASPTAGRRCMCS